MSTAIRVVVADGSAIVRRILARCLGSAGGIEVVGEAADARTLVDQTRRHQPDVVTLGLGLPGSDPARPEEIVVDCSAAVVVVSGSSGGDAAEVRRALDAGAVDFVLKYRRDRSIDPDELRREVVSKVRHAARQLAAPVRHPRAEPAAAERPRAAEQVVVVGASTGGPLALRELLGALPEPFAAAVLVVQHMPGSFTGILAEQLSRHLGRPVRQARDGDPAVAGEILLAPGDHHLVLDRERLWSTLAADQLETQIGAVDCAMQAAAEVVGKGCHGVVLTGMGQDGAEGLRAIRQHGGTTYAQSIDTCVAGGMPQHAIDLGVADHVARPAEVAALLAGALQRFDLSTRTA